jgi:hypothetical protein
VHYLRTYGVHGEEEEVFGWGLRFRLPGDADELADANRRERNAQGCMRADARAGDSKGIVRPLQPSRRITRVVIIVGSNSTDSEILMAGLADQQDTRQVQMPIHRHGIATAFERIQS